MDITCPDKAQVLLLTFTNMSTNQIFSGLTREDQIAMERQRGYAHQVAKNLGFPTIFQGATEDLLVLQKIIDSSAISPTQTWELQSLGIVLGDVFAGEKGLHWVIVEDEYGRDPALRFNNTSNLVFALTMISKRIEDGKTVDIQAIYEGVCDHIDQFTE